jgi:hypothetical protein
MCSTQPHFCLTQQSALRNGLATGVVQGIPCVGDGLTQCHHNRRLRRASAVHHNRQSSAAPMHFGEDKVRGESVSALGEGSFHAAFPATMHHYSPGCRSILVRHRDS